MARILVLLALPAAALAVGAAVLAGGSQAAPHAAAATIQRTFVSTGGNDANPCTRTQPCRNFFAAIPNTTAGGEVVALDSGGYGALTLNKAIQIIGAPGAHVAVTAFAGAAVDVNAGATDEIVLRNLYLTGLGAESGIHFAGGHALRLEDVTVTGFTYGLEGMADDATVTVHNATFADNDYAVLIGHTERFEIADSRANGNNILGFGFYGNAAGTIAGSAASNQQYGAEFAGGSTTVVTDSTFDSNKAGVRLEEPGTTVTLTRVTLSNNSDFGLQLRNDLPGAPFARIAESTVTGNAVGLAQEAGTLESFQDNLVRGNTTNTSGTITPVGKT